MTQPVNAQQAAAQVLQDKKLAMFVRRLKKPRPDKSR
jgi:hypothetical protein